MKKAGHQSMAPHPLFPDHQNVRSLDSMTAHEIYIATDSYYEITLLEVMPIESTYPDNRSSVIIAVNRDYNGKSKNNANTCL